MRFYWLLLPLIWITFGFGAFTITNDPLIPNFLAELLVVNALIMSFMWYIGALAGSMVPRDGGQA